MISSSRAGVSPAFQNVCHCSRGLWITSPGIADQHVVAEQHPNLAFEHKGVLVLAVARCMGAASKKKELKIHNVGSEY